VAPIVVVVVGGGRGRVLVLTDGKVVVAMMVRGSSDCQHLEYK
jgi:hypothetical protein